MERNELLKNIHNLKNDEMIDLGNDFKVERTFDVAWFMYKDNIYLELNMLSQQTLFYEKRLNQFIDYIMQYIK